MIKIGIDPDVDKSGYAMLIGNKVEQLDCFNFFDLIKELKEFKEYCDTTKTKYLVSIEKGEDNGNGHLYNAVKAGLAAYKNPKIKRKTLIDRISSGLRVAAQAGMRTGKNFEITDLLVQFCELNDINHKTYTPTTAKWKSHDYVCKLVKGMPKTSNQEKRDAIRAAL